MVLFQQNIVWPHYFGVPKSRSTGIEGDVMANNGDVKSIILSGRT